MITGHCRRVLADDALTTQDAVHVILSGAIFAEPEVDSRSTKWKYKIEGNCPAGVWLAVVFTFEGDSLLILITAFAVMK